MSSDSETTSAERPYLAILSPSILRALALISLGSTGVLIVLGLSIPMYFEIDIARFILCLAVATTLSIFFFIFYPQSFALTLPLLIGFSLRVVGPIALWFGILLFLWQWIPAARGGRVYKPTINDKPGVMYYDDQSVLWVPGSKEELEYRWIKNKGDRMLYGVYIEFKDNIRVYHAKLEHKPYATIDVTFNRDGPFTFSVSDFHKRKD